MGSPGLAPGAGIPNPQDGVYTWDPHMGIPYNARARNVRACPRARPRNESSYKYRVSLLELRSQFT